MVRGVSIYSFLRVTPSGSKMARPASSAAVVCHKVNDLSLVVTLPWVQQAPSSYLPTVAVRFKCDRVLGKSK